MPDLSRASWAVVRVDEKGELLLKMHGGLVQTSKFGLFTTGNAVAEKKVNIPFRFRVANYLGEHNL